MGIASIVGRIAKAFKGGGRLAKNVIDKGRQIIGKVSPFIKKGFEFAQRIPGFINNAKRKKEQVSDDIKGVKHASEMKADFNDIDYVEDELWM